MIPEITSESRVYLEPRGPTFLLLIIPMVWYPQGLLVLGNHLLRSGFANQVSSSLGVGTEEKGQVRQYC